MRIRAILALIFFIVVITATLYKCGIILFDVYENEEYSIFTGEILSDGVEKEYIISYEIRIKNKNKNYKALVYFNKKNKYEVGDVITFKGKFQKQVSQRNYGGFDYRLFLKTKGICGIFVDSSVVKVQKTTFKNPISVVRKEIIQLFNNRLKNKNAGLIIGLTIGDKSYIDKETKESFVNASLSHVLAISGTHFAYIIMMLKLIRKIIKSRNIALVTEMLGVAFFIGLTGGSPSVVRAGLLCIIKVLGNLFNRKIVVWYSFSLVFLIQLLMNPYVIFDLGFILSYCGTAGILLFYKKLKKKIKYNSVCLALSANIVLLPIVAYNFNKLPFNFLISNFLSSLLLAPILILGYVSCVLRNSIVFTILDLLLDFFRVGTEFCANMPLSNLIIITPSIISIICYYVLVYLLFWNRKKTYIIICIVVIICSNFHFAGDNLIINFIDVDQGDCTLVRCDGKNILIDSGGSESESYDVGKSTLLPYLLNRGINKLDYIIYSHFDSDHCKGSIYLLNNIKVKKIIIGIQKENYENYIKIKQIANSKKIKIIQLQKGDMFNITEHLSMYVLWPSKDMLIMENAINNNSLVFKMLYKKYSVLFTGDIEKIAEERILNLYFKNKEILRATVLKVAHHGSKSSSIEAFINAVKPSYALIGVGRNNNFGHPNEGVLKRLKENNIAVYRTDLNGEITLSFEKTIKISTMLKIKRNDNIS